uniref:Immunoglobulin V-set domain-containing protein n=1 Tax=Salmo trutta TaxID=8032 RepID=A0A674ESW3_SALTR
MHTFLSSVLVPRGNRTHNPGVAKTMLYQLSHTGPRYNAMPTEEVTIFWRYKDDRNVYIIVSGKADLTDQDRQFRNRIRIFPEECANGNFSLLLTDLKDSDSGSYSCFIPTVNIHHQVELSVQEKPTPEPKIGPKSSSVSLKG